MSLTNRAWLNLKRFCRASKMHFIENKVPAVRFMDFVEEWEQRKLETIFNKIRNAFVGTATPYYVGSGNFYLESNNVKDGQINRKSEVFISDEFHKKQSDKWLRTGDIVMVQSGHVGHTAVIPPELNNIAAHALIMFTEPKEKCSPYFLNFQFQTVKSKRKLSEITTGNTIKHILSSEMKEYEVLLPHAKEQTKIGNYFQQLDTLITQHQQKHDKLLNIKKSLLEKMFPRAKANDELGMMNAENNSSDNSSLSTHHSSFNVPEIRFKGFSGPWEEKMLGDICEDTYGGGTPSTSKSEYWNGDIPWIQSSDIIENTVGNVESRKNITKSGLKNSATKIIPKNSIAIVTRVGVGKLSLMKNKYATSQDFLSLSRLNIDCVYGVYVIWKKMQSEKLAVQGTSIKGITKEELLNKEVYIPKNKREQTKIGNLFKQLDTLINQHQAQLKKLNNIKQACLEKMFV